jgi:signal transduction histidine kinase
LGFDTQAPRSSNQIGLWSMRKRVHDLGGNLSIRSAPGEGTALSAQVPI